MPGIEFEDRMSSADAVMWAVEKDPLLRSTMVGVVVLDRVPDRAALGEVWERASRLVPRLRQRVLSNPYSVAPPRWAFDPNFDLDYHLRFVRVPGAGTLRDVLDVVQPFAAQPLDRARPLWEILAIDGLEGGRGAFAMKLHHAITDGVGFVNLSMNFLDLERDGWEHKGPMPEVPAGDIPSMGRRLVEGIEHEAREAQGLLGRVVRRVAGTVATAARDPRAALRDTTGLTGSVTRTLRPSPTPLSSLMTGRSLSRRIDVLDIPVDDLKAAAKLAGGRLNDAFVAGVLGGLQRYHDRLGAPAEGLRMNMPVSVRTEDAAAGGNQFVPARFVVPLGIDDPVDRMRAIRDLVEEVRAEPALDLVTPISTILYRLGTSVSTAAFSSMMRGVDLVTSNVPGAPMDVYVAGTKMEAQYALGPNAGAAVNFTLLSYRGTAHITVGTDTAAVDDVDALLADIRESFDEIAALTRP